MATRIAEVELELGFDPDRIARDLSTTLAGALSEIAGRLLSAAYPETGTPSPVTIADVQRTFARQPDEHDDIEEGQAKQADDAFEFAPDEPGEPVTLRAAIFQALGAASVAWKGEVPQGVFNSERATEIGEALLGVIEGAQRDRIAELEAERSRLAGIIRTAADALHDTTVRNWGHDVALVTGVERVRNTLAEIDARGDA